MALQGALAEYMPADARLIALKPKSLSMKQAAALPIMHDIGRKKHGAILKELAQIVDAGGLTPLLDPSDFTLDQVGETHAKLESGAATVNVVISV